MVIGAGSSLGYVGIPFEQASYGLHILRLGQRLIALYGQDPLSISETLLLKSLSKIFGFEQDSSSQRTQPTESLLNQIKNTGFHTAFYS